MSPLRWLKAALGNTAAAVSLVSPWLRNVVWTISRNFLVLAREGYGENAIVYACLRLLSQSVPEPPLLVYQVQPDLQRVPVPFDHPLQQLIRQPNPLMTEYEMIELMTLHLSIVGRTHWFKQRDNLGRVAAIWPLRPDRVGPHYGGVANTEIASDSRDAAPGAGQQVLTGWNYWPPGMGEPVVLSIDDVISMNYPDPAGETGGIVEGLGPLQVLSREVESDNEATNFVAALLKNSAVPGSILKLKASGLSKEQAAKVKRGWMAQFGGTKRGEPAILDADTDYQSVGFDLSQLEFPQLRGFSESRIASCFGVPAIMVGLHVAVQASIKATISEQREYFAETTLTNLWRRISDQMTNHLANEYGDRLVCRFDTTQVKALAQQSKLQVQPIAVAFAQGAVTIDEYRVNVLNLTPLPNGVGDVLMIPTTFATSPADLDESDLVDSENEDDSAFQGKMRRLQVRGGSRRPLRAHKAVDTSKIRARQTRRISKHTKANEAAIAGYLKDLAVTVRQRVLTKATTKDIGLNADAMLTPEDSAKLLALLQALWNGALEDAYDDASDDTGVDISFDVSNAGVKALLDSLATRVKNIDDTTRDAIRARVGQANEEGWSIPQLAASLKQDSAFAPARARTIARTESGTAYNTGGVTAYKQSGVVSQVQVMDGDDDPECAEADGQTWDLDQAQAEPLQHPNCVRAFAPIVDVAAGKAAA
ncbi:MAG: phage portal protein [Acidiferrobacterales bacterium]